MKFNFYLVLFSLLFIIPNSYAEPVDDANVIANLPVASLIDAKTFEKDLQNLGMIVGAVYDSSNGYLHLIGNHRYKECSPTVQQIAVAFRWAFSDNPDTLFVSIDPLSNDPYAPWMEVRISSEANDTEFGWIMFEADRLLKGYSLGKDNVTGRRVSSTVQDYQNILQINLRQEKKVDSDKVWSRFWFYPRRGSMEAIGNIVRIKEAVVGIRTQTMVWEHGKLVLASGVVDLAAEQFARFFTEHYAKFADEEPIFRKLEQLMRLLLICEWARQRFLFHVEGVSPRDLDNEKITEKLRQAFAHHHVSLSSNSIVQTLRKGSTWRIRNPDGVHSYIVKKVGKKKNLLNIYHERQIPLNLEWLEQFSRKSFRIPRITPSIQVYGEKRQRNRNSINIQTIHLFGGVDLNIQPDYVSVGPQFNQWVSRLSKGRYTTVVFPAGTQQLAFTPIRVIEQITLPYGKPLKIRRHPRNIADSNIPNRSEVTWELALPSLRAYYPEGREGVIQTFGIQGKSDSQVKVRHYELYDEEGKPISRFEEYSIDQQRGEVEVYPAQSTSDWRLYPKAEGVVVARGPDNTVLVFDETTGKIIGEQFANHLIHYEYNNNGILSQITADDRSEYVEVIQGNNGHRIIGVRAKNGTEVYFIKRISNMTPQTVKAYNEAGEPYTVEISPETGNWSWKEDQSQIPPGLDYLNRYALEISRTIGSSRDKSIVAMIPDGGITMLIVGATIHLLPVPFDAAVLAEEWIWNLLPVDTPIRAIEQSPDGQIAVLHDVHGELALAYLQHGETIRSFKGPNALAKFHETEYNVVKQASTETTGFVYGAIEGKHIVMQMGNVGQVAIPYSEFEAMMVQPEMNMNTPLDTMFARTQKMPQKWVIYRGALSRSPILSAQDMRGIAIPEPVQLAVVLRRRYPEMEVYLDDRFQRARQNVTTIQPVQNGNALCALVPIESFEVTDHGFISMIENSLNQNNIVIVKDALEVVKFQDILLISGHNDEKLQQYLTYLGEQGVLKDKVLMLNTCYADGNPEFIHSLIQRYQLKAVFYTIHQIRPIGLMPVVHYLGKIVNEIERTGQALHPYKLIDQAIKRALTDKKDQSEDVQIEIEKFRDSIMQVSQAQSTSEVFKAS